jgi:hypothetical protein
MTANLSPKVGPDNEDSTQHHSPIPKADLLEATTVNVAKEPELHATAEMEQDAVTKTKRGY